MNNIEVVSDPEIINAYGVDVSAIAAKKAACEALSFDTPAEYRASSKELSEVKGTRVGIEKRRKEMNADALEYTRKVNTTAKQLTAMVLEIEEPLQAKKDAADAAKKAAKEAEEEKKREAVAAQMRAIHEAEEKRLAEERAELDRRRAEQEAREQAVQERLAAEREAFEAEKRAAAEARHKADEAERNRPAAEAEKLAEEKRQLEAERAAIAAQREATELAEAERLAKIEAERVAVEAAKQAEAAAEHKRQREIALRPCKAVLLDYVDEVTALMSRAPAMDEPEADAALEECLGLLDKARDALLDFTGAVEVPMCCADGATNSVSLEAMQ